MHGNDYTSVLRSGESLSNRAVSCPTGEYTLVHQQDGNVVIYRNDDAVAIWATGTNFQSGVEVGPRRVKPEQFGPAGRLLLREDGELVVLKPDGEQLWSSGTAGSGGTDLMIHDWGKLVLKNESGHILWQSQRAPRRWSGWNQVPDGRRLRRRQRLRGQSLTSDNGEYSLVVTHDGIGYLCRTGGPVLWAASMSHGHGLALTEDGLGSVSADGIFRPGNGLGLPHDVAAAEIFVSDDGLLTFVDDEGAVLWAGPELPSQPAPREPKPPVAVRAPIDLSEYHEFENLIVRTDYTDDDGWAEVVDLLASPWADDEPAVSLLITDAVWDGASPEEVLAALPDEAPQVVLIADGPSMTGQHPLLAVRIPDVEDDDLDLSERQFRVRPEAAAEMFGNLALGNMDVEDFASSARTDPDRMHHGFS